MAAFVLVRLKAAGLYHQNLFSISPLETRQKTLQKKQLHRMARNYSLHKLYCLVSLLLIVFGLAFKLFSAAY